VPSTATGSADSPPFEVHSKALLSVLVAGCGSGAAPGRPRVALPPVGVVNATSYSWETWAGLRGEGDAEVPTDSGGGGGGGGEGAPDGGSQPTAPPLPGPGPARPVQPDQAAQVLLEALLRQQAAARGAAGPGPGAAGRRRLQARRARRLAAAKGAAGAAAPAPGDAQQPAYVPIGLNQVATLGVRARFTRTLVSQEWKLTGTVRLTAPLLGHRSLPKGRVTVVALFDDGTTVRGPADCSGDDDGDAAAGGALALPAPPGVLECDWTLPAPPGAGSGAGRVFALLEGASPAPVAGPAAFSFAAAKADVRGACAAIRASWTVESRGGSGSVAQPRPVPPAAAAGGAPAQLPPPAGSLVQICRSMAFAWDIAVGPFGATQCDSGLALVGAASVRPGTGGVAKTSAARVRVELGGCPAAPLGGGAGSALLRYGG
jgi:hypothetical protein